MQSGSEPVEEPDDPSKTPTLRLRTLGVEEPDDPSKTPTLRLRTLGVPISIDG